MGHWPVLFFRMKSDASVLKTAERKGQRFESELRLRVELEPRYRIFLQNFSDLIWPRRQAALHLSSRPSEFWPDIFVGSALPWRGFFQSCGVHLLFLSCALLLAHFLPRRTTITTTFSSREDVLYYSPAEYLQPIDSGTRPVPSAAKGGPEHSRQTLISVPSGSENRRQTVVTPPDVKANHDLNLPDVVAWNPIIPTVPPDALGQLSSSARALTLSPHVIAPPPELSGSPTRRVSMLQPHVVQPSPGLDNLRTRASLGLRQLQVPQSAIVGPAPELAANLSGKRRNVHLGNRQVVAPAPKLEKAAERNILPLQASLGAPTVVQPAPDVDADFSRRSRLNLPQQVVVPAPNLNSALLSARQRLNSQQLHSANSVVAPPPSLQGVRERQSNRQLIVLNVQPLALAKAVDVRVANRRGTFAATPEGKAGAAGTPDTVSSASRQNSGHQSIAGVPPGIYVGSSGSPTQTRSAETGSGNVPEKNPVLMAKVTPPRVGGTQRLATEGSGATALERQVFGDRKFYSMSLNLPNLNSVAGSWVIHFAELNGNASGEALRKSGLIAPEATHEVDPAYPLELMQEHIHGTVVLYAVIRSDGSVGGVRVLQGVDDRLDRYACEALMRWHFLPALKNGTAVDLAAVVKIPFRATREKSSF